jgi:hypothetical protein
LEFKDAVGLPSKETLPPHGAGQDGLEGVLDRVEAPDVLLGKNNGNSARKDFQGHLRNIRKP